MSNQPKNKLFVRIMAWILSILMVGSLATTIVAIIVSLLS